MAEVCLFCGENLYQDKRPICTVSKGLSSITDKRLQYEDGLHTKLKDYSSTIALTDCRKSYMRPGSKREPASKDEPMLETPSLYPSMRQFEFKTDCSFYGEEVSTEIEKKKDAKFRQDVYEVRTTEMRDRVTAQALEKRDAQDVVALARAKNVVDLVAAEALYHNQCYARYFFSGRITNEQARGRPGDAGKQSAFDTQLVL